ncbi:MAG: glycosyltransferase family 4 protein [Minisyncoccia bacterium]
MSIKMEEAGVAMKNFYPSVSLDAPAHMGGLKNILFFHSLVEKRAQILKFDLIQGTTYTPLPFLAYSIPVITHFGSSTRGFLDATPRATSIEDGPKQVWYRFKHARAIKELNVRTRRPLRDIAEIEQYVAMRSEAVIATSLKVRDELIHIGVEEAKIHLIHNAIEDYWFENSKHGFVDEPHLVFLGRIGNDAFNLKLKGLDRLIHVYEQFKNVKKTTVCITTNKSLILWLADNIPNHSLFVNVKKDEIPGIIKKLRGSICFIPSRYEGFSLSLVEAMAQGLVPVIYSVGVAPEIIRNGENGFIVSSQKEAIEKIKLLLKDAKLRNKCSIEAENTARLFSSSTISKKLMKLYTSVVKENQ